MLLHDYVASQMIDERNRKLTQVSKFAWQLSLFQKEHDRHARQWLNPAEQTRRQQASCCCPCVSV